MISIHALRAERDHTALADAARTARKISIHALRAERDLRYYRYAD